MIVRLLLSLVLIVGVAATAPAADIGSDDRQSIRTIISGQLEAFQRDDGEAAYGYASPIIQGLFPTADIFMEMVRSGYQPVYRPRSVTFGEIADAPGGPLQKVFLTGPDGRNWLAIYTLQRQPDGSWRINGCRLVEDDGATI